MRSDWGAAGRGLAGRLVSQGWALAWGRYCRQCRKRPGRCGEVLGQGTASKRGKGMGEGAYGKLERAGEAGSTPAFTSGIGLPNKSRPSDIPGPRQKGKYPHERFSFL